MKYDKNTMNTGHKAPAKGSAPFTPIQRAKKIATLINKVKSLMQPFVQKYRSVTVLAIALLAALLWKLLGVL
jgi:hypothetical protein